MHALDEAEVEVFRFWVDRLQREYREPKTEFNEQVSVRFYYLQAKSFKINQRLMRGANYGKDQDELTWAPRPKL